MKENIETLVKDLKEGCSACRSVIKTAKNMNQDFSIDTTDVIRDQKIKIQKKKETIALLQKENIVELYHVTASINIASICSKGLTIGKNTGVSIGKQNKLFFWDTMEKAEKFQKDMFAKNNIDSVILTVFLPKNKIKKTADSIYGEEYFTSENISLTYSPPLKQGDSFRKTLQ